MPTLSVRAFAEMLNLPAYEQQRILIEQKYPRQQPQTFKIPYYQPALRGIRAYYLEGNNRATLTRARTEARALTIQSRAAHNLRVINAFDTSRQAQRQIFIQPQPNIAFEPTPGVSLRLKFDIFGDERGNAKRIFYNVRNAPLDPDIARLTLEVAHWILVQVQMPVAYAALEYVDLEGGDTTRIAQTSPRSIRMIAANSKIIATLWPTL